MYELTDIEQIQRLKYRYLRALDTHDWAAFADCFAEDATSSYSDGALSFKGREAITEGISSAMDSPLKISTHQVHHPQIDQLSETTARGQWYLQDFVICEDEGWLLQGAAFYHDEYVKLEGRWLHSHIGYERTFECRTPLADGFAFTELGHFFKQA